MVYEHEVAEDVRRWRRRLTKRPSLTTRTAKRWQKKWNGMLPEKWHALVTETIKKMIEATITGSVYTARKLPEEGRSLKEREEEVRRIFRLYHHTAVAEGIGTGAGGVLIGMTDFPLLISIKMKALFETATAYGYDVSDYRERLFILLVFQLAFSEGEHRDRVLARIDQWEVERAALPEEQSAALELDWRSLQINYRDFLDLAKILQLIPGFGAIFGAAANHRLLELLEETAMNAYRMRWLAALPA
ncbi:EcsC family protein [Shouchella shacheensis]|uniref:EcsC family protein n=1 Tax=Shouchella shacheensis TaxID=1649580 RepID=UPI003462932F